MAAAVAKVTPSAGDTINVLPGTYTSTMTWNKSNCYATPIAATASISLEGQHNLTIQKAPLATARPIFKGAVAGIGLKATTGVSVYNLEFDADGNKSQFFVVCEGSNNTTFSGLEMHVDRDQSNPGAATLERAVVHKSTDFTFTGGEMWTRGANETPSAMCASFYFQGERHRIVGVVQSSHRAKFTQSYFHHFAQGFSVDSSNDFEFTRNRVEHFAAHGFTIRRGSGGVLVENNIFQGDWDCTACDRNKCACGTCNYTGPENCNDKCWNGGRPIDIYECKVTATRRCTFRNNTVVGMGYIWIAPLLYTYNQATVAVCDVPTSCKVGSIITNNLVADIQFNAPQTTSRFLRYDIGNNNHDDSGMFINGNWYGGNASNGWKCRGTDHLVFNNWKNDTVCKSGDLLAGAHIPSPDYNAWFANYYQGDSADDFDVGNDQADFLQGGINGAAYCATVDYNGDSRATDTTCNPGAFRDNSGTGGACGDGVLDPGEDCDTVTEIAGDCCDMTGSTPGVDTCVFEIASTACDDGQYCFTGETCSGSSATCPPGPSARTCSDANVCTQDSCDDSADVCVNEACVALDASCSTTAIVFDETSTSGLLNPTVANSFTRSYNHSDNVANGDNMVAVVFVSGKEGTGGDVTECIPTSVTFGGTPMTLQRSVQVTDTSNFKAWLGGYVLALGTPGAGAATVQIVWPAQCDNAHSISSTFKEVNQTSPVGELQSTVDSGGTTGSSNIGLGFLNASSGNVIVEGFFNGRTIDVSSPAYCDQVEKGQSNNAAGSTVVAVLEVDSSTEQLGWVLSSAQFRLLQVAMELNQNNPSAVFGAETVQGGSGELNTK